MAFTHYTSSVRLQQQFLLPTWLCYDPQGCGLGSLLFVMYIGHSFLAFHLLLTYLLTYLQLFLSFHQSKYVHANITHKTLYCTIDLFLDDCQSSNSQVSTLLKLNFFFLKLNNYCPKYKTPLFVQPTLLATVALFLTNTAPFRPKPLLFRNLAVPHSWTLL